MGEKSVSLSLEGYLCGNGTEAIRSKGPERLSPLAEDAVLSLAPSLSQGVFFFFFFFSFLKLVIQMVHSSALSQ